MSITPSLESLTDDQILSGLHDLLGQSRRVEAPLVAHIGEVHARHLYARFAASSMFCYCTQVLHLSEGEAQLRIKVAEAARAHPVLLEMLADGRLNLSGIAKLAPVLTADNRDRLLAHAVHKSKHQIEELVAEVAPRPDVPSVIRKLPERSVSPPVGVILPDETGVEIVRPVADVDASPPALPVRIAPPTQRPVIEPLSPARYKVQFTAGPELRDDLQRLRALMRSEAPDGDLAVVIGRAVSELRQRLEARRYAQTKSPRAKIGPADGSSRQVPAATRRVVYRRDGSQCCYVDEQGRRCAERHLLEFHHRDPYARGGSHDPENICLMCHAHNEYLAQLAYGKEKMARYWRRGAVRRAPAESRSAEVTNAKPLR